MPIPLTATGWCSVRSTQSLLIRSWTGGWSRECCHGYSWMGVSYSSASGGTLHCMPKPTPSFSARLTLRTWTTTEPGKHSQPTSPFHRIVSPMPIKAGDWPPRNGVKGVPVDTLLKKLCKMINSNEQFEMYSSFNLAVVLVCRDAHLVKFPPWTRTQLFASRRPMTTCDGPSLRQPASPKTLLPLRWPDTMVCRHEATLAGGRPSGKVWTPRALQLHWSSAHLQDHCAGGQLQLRLLGVRWGGLTFRPTIWRQALWHNLVTTRVLQLLQSRTACLHPKYISL